MLRFCKRHSAIIILLLVLAIVVFPQKGLRTEEKALIPRALLFGNPEKQSPLLSPDGTKLAYLAPDAQEVLNVWVCHLDEKEAAVCITSDKKRGIHSFCWQYDNAHILYAQDRDGDENWHLYQTNLATKATRDLTPFEGTRTELIAYQHEYPEEILVAINLRDRALFDVYRINLGSGDIELDTQNPGLAHQYAVDNTLTVRAIKSYTPNAEVVIHTREDAHSPWKELIRWGSEETVGNLAGFSSDNSSLYLTTSIDNNTARLLKYNLATGEKEVLAEDVQYDVGHPLRNPHSHNIDAVTIDRDKPEWIVLNPDVEEDFAFLTHCEQAPFALMSRDLQDQKWVVAYSSDTHPTHYYLYDRNRKEIQFLFTTKPELEKYFLAKMTPVHFEARDGMKLFGYLTLPTGQAPYHLPTVLLVHGGPWSRDHWGLQPSVQWLANRGYAVLQINYRGSSGYGKEHIQAGNKEWGAKMLDDLLDGKNWLVKQGIANPEKVAIFGGSYGGYATLAALAFNPEEFCCGVDIVGPSNLITLIKTVPPYWSAMKAQLLKRVGDPETEEEFLKERSPLFQAHRIVKPLLIAQGANDPRVKQVESDQIVQAMRQNGKEVEYLLFPDEGHGFTCPQNKMKFFAATEQFLTTHLGGNAEPPCAEECWEEVKK